MFTWPNEVRFCVSEHFKTFLKIRVWGNSQIYIANLYPAIPYFLGIDKIIRIAKPIFAILIL